ncbi:LuxR C-terminal-related transcriptional regulator [Kribbella sp. NBC_00359]|uniref:LuxR C-terminal-related transcriptional regulator n=1 Tax=Kribbella sp. NBC_00359 TaxID=2975966 RepID=UPI002E20F85E
MAMESRPTISVFEWRGVGGGVVAAASSDQHDERQGAQARPSVGKEWNVVKPWPLIGRETETAAFIRTLADPASRGMVLSGPTGVGKSRLAEEFLSVAAEEGHQVRRAVASRAASTVPLGAIAHLISADVNMSDPAAAFGATVPARPQPGDARYVLMIDDAHLLDATSAILLKGLLATGAIYLLASARDDESVAPPVQAMLRADGMVRTDLSPFDVTEVRSVLQTVLGHHLSKYCVSALYDASEGNVLYLRELVIGALRANKLTLDRGIWELAEGQLPGTPHLLEVVALRLSRAEPESRRPLEMLAVCGPLELANLREVTSQTTLTQLADHGLIKIIRDGRRETAALSHPIYGDVLRERLPILVRRTVLLRQVERIRAMGARRREDALTLTSWQLAATGTSDPELLREAARRAAQVHDYGHVIRLMEALFPADHTADTLIVLAGAYFLKGKWELAEAVLVEAEAKAISESQHVSVATFRVTNLLWGGASVSRALMINDAARERIATARGHAILDYNEACALVCSNRPVEALAMLEELEGDPSRSPSQEGWLFGASLKVTGLAMTGRTLEALAWVERVHAVSLDSPPEMRPLASDPSVRCTLRVHALTEAGRLSEACKIGSSAHDDLLRAGMPNPRVWLAVFLGRAEWLAGHPITARHWFAEAVGLTRELDFLGARRIALSGLAATWALTGDLAASEATVAEMLDVPEPESRLLPRGEELLGEAWLLAARGNLFRACNALLDAAKSARDSGHFTSEALLLADVARLGGAKDARTRLNELALLCDGDLMRARARLATALTSHDACQLMEVAEELDCLGADLLAAEAYTIASVAFRQTDHTHRSTAATARASARLRLCEGAKTPILGAAEAMLALTAREQEIGFLAASGATSKNIAETLSISVRTVDNTLQRAYTKLGITNRRELGIAIGLNRYAE